jgi:hypothetical protein
MWILTREAISLIREKRAREVYDQGRFVGIQLCTSPPETGELLPPAELPGLVFEDPNPARKYARFHWEN